MRTDPLVGCSAFDPWPSRVMGVETPSGRQFGRCEIGWWEITSPVGGYDHRMRWGLSRYALRPDLPPPGSNDD